MEFSSYRATIHVEINSKWCIIVTEAAYVIRVKRKMSSPKYLEAKLYTVRQHHSGIAFVNLQAGSAGPVRVCVCMCVRV